MDDEYETRMLARAFDESGDDYFKIKEDAEKALAKVKSEIAEVKANFEKSKKELYDTRDQAMKRLLPRERNCNYILGFLNKVKKGKMRNRRKKGEKDNTGDKSRTNKEAFE